MAVGIIVMARSSRDDGSRSRRSPRCGADAPPSSVASSCTRSRSRGGRGHDHDVGRERPQRDCPCRDRPGGHRLRLRRLGVPPVRGQAFGHRGRRGDRGVPVVRIADLEFACKAGTKASTWRTPWSRRARSAMASASAPTPPRERPATPRVLGRGRLRLVPVRRRRRQDHREVLHTYSWATDTPTSGAASTCITRATAAASPASRPTSATPPAPPAASSRRPGSSRRLRLRRLPPAQRQVPDEGRQDARLHRGSAGHRLAVALARQHILRRLADGPDRDPRRCQARRPHPPDLVRLRRRLRLVSSSGPPPGSRGPGAGPKTDPARREKDLLDYGSYAKLRARSGWRSRRWRCAK